MKEKRLLNVPASRSLVAMVPVVSVKPGYSRENAAVIAAIAKVTEELGDNGRILVRESGTEPVLRVMVEAESNELCAKYVKQVIDVICSEGLIVLD